MKRSSSVGPDRLLPLRPVVFHTLVALAARSRHGYAIAQEVEEQTRQAIRMGPGTLYGTLQRMSRDGLIEECTSDEPPSSHEQRRRYYGITDLGRQLLQAETRRLERALDLATDRLALSEAEGRH